LSDFISKKEQFVSNLDPKYRLDFWIEDVEEKQPPSSEIHDTIAVKVVRRKSNENILNSKTR
jgi:hypothetical protein